MSSEKEVVNKAEAHAAKSKPQQVLLKTERGMAEQYPTSQLSAADARDQMMLLRSAIGEKFGKQTFKDEDAMWLLRKLEAAKDADFQAWFAKRFDRMRPEQKKWARQALPRFYKQRLQTLDENIDTLKKLASIRIRGIENANDLALMYAAEKGLFNFENLRDILHPERARLDDMTPTMQFTRGLFNINTYYTSEQPGYKKRDGTDVFVGRTNSRAFDPATRANATNAVTGINYGETTKTRATGMLSLI